MKGVILAGGTGTRLRPLTNLINKHLLPVGKFPMIEYPLQKLHDAGVRDVLIILGKHSAGLYLEYLGSGNERGLRLTYRVQEQSGGIAEALALAEGFIHPDEKFVVMLGDNLLGDDLTPFINEFQLQETGARVLLTPVSDPRRYGVPVFNENRIVAIEEKPEHPKSSFCVTGVYMYDSEVFDVIRTIHPSARGELEITDVNNYYARQGTLSYNILQNWWVDAGTHQSIFEAAQKIGEGEGY
ncbi:MAG: NTP transferase domain-containing protein [Alicyclobacillus sp.]|nr:NTP transferase domain-containing protein [Alicyclobacillus sp.]